MKIDADGSLVMIKRLVAFFVDGAIFLIVWKALFVFFEELSNFFPFLLVATFFLVDFFILHRNKEKVLNCEGGEVIIFKFSYALDIILIIIFYITSIVSLIQNGFGVLKA